MIDLHIHTTASDGEHSPSEIVAMAKDLNLSAIAITDHDTVSGVEEAMKAARDSNIEVIPGIEVSADYKKTMHILGYYIDYKNRELVDVINELSRRRNERNLKIIEALNSMGMDITYEEVSKNAGGESIGKPHFVKAMLDKKYISSNSEGYDNYFNKEPLSLIEKVKYSPKDTIEMIIKAGGVPVLAHPYLLGLSDEELDDLIRELKNFGLMGIEVYHSEHSKEATNKYIRLANKYSLIITGGTDFHGENVKNGLKLGSGINGNVSVDNDQIVDNIKDCIKRRSSRLVLINDNKVLLFERNKNGKHYYAFPGGGVELGESYLEALIREAKEEICADIVSSKLIYTYDGFKTQQEFFKVTISNDLKELKFGEGEEFTDSARGTYEMVWLNIDDITDEVKPASVAKSIKELKGNNQDVINISE